MATLAEVLRGYKPPTTSALGDPIVEHFRNLPENLEKNQRAMDKTMAGMYKTDFMGKPNPNYYPEAMQEFTQNYLPNFMGSTNAVKGLINGPVTGFLDQEEYRRVGKFQPTAEYTGTSAGGTNPLSGVIEGRGAGARGQSSSDIAKANAEVNRLIQNPDLNPAVQLAREINPQFNLEAIKAMPKSSLDKQFSIAKAFDTLAKDEVDPALQGKIFANYLRAYPEIRKSAATNYNELIPASYEQLSKENADIFERMMNKDMRFSYGTEGVNYNDSPELLRDALLNKHMYTYRGGDPHQYLNRVDPYTGLNENEIFRAVHDYTGHGTTGSSFGPVGEELAYGAHSQLYSPLAKIAAASETRGQNSLVNYSGMNAELQNQMKQVRAARQEAISKGMDPTPFDEQLRQLGGQWEYAPQKSILLPPEMLDMQYAGGMPDYLKKYMVPNSPETAAGYHWSNIPDLTQTNPAMYGTGTKGAEAQRLAEGLRNRSYFYTNPNLRESGLGGNQYQAELKNMYNLGNDPDKLAYMSSMFNEGNPEAKRNTFENILNQAGYEGYINPDYQAGVSFVPQDIKRIK